MISPCNNCPFRRSVRFPLGTERRAEIAQSILRDSPFGCHKTTQFDEDNQYYWTHREQPCVGAAVLIQRERGDFRANLAFRLGFASGKLPESIPDCPDVYQSAHEFINTEE